MGLGIKTQGGDLICNPVSAAPLRLVELFGDALRGEEYVDEGANTNNWITQLQV